MSERPGPDTIAEVRRLLAEQAKIRAIKLYREATGANLVTAKAAVESIGAEEPPPARPPLPRTGAEARAISEALRAGKGIEAIRLYRAATGTGLAEAKLAIDNLVAEGRAGPWPAWQTWVIERRRFSPILVLLALAGLFGTIFGSVILLLGRP